MFPWGSHHWVQTTGRNSWSSWMARHVVPISLTVMRVGSEPSPYPFKEQPLRKNSYIGSVLTIRPPWRSPEGSFLSLIFLYMYACVSRVALVVKNLPAIAADERDIGLIPELGRSPGGGHGNPLQYPCLENPTDRGAWQAIYSTGACKESDTTEAS